MKTANLLAAFVVTGLLTWSGLGSVASAQHEPMRAEVAEPRTTRQAPQRELDVNLLGAESSRGREHANRVGGFFLIGLGAAGLVGGGVLAIAADLVQHPICISNPFSDGASASCPGHDASSWWAGMGVSLGLGALSMIVGITMVVSSRHHDVPAVRVALTPTEGGAFGSLSFDL